MIIACVVSIGVCRRYIYRLSWPCSDVILLRSFSHKFCKVGSEHFMHIPESWIFKCKHANSKHFVTCKKSPCGCETNFQSCPLASWCLKHFQCASGVLHGSFELLMLIFTRRKNDKYETESNNNGPNKWMLYRNPMATQEPCGNHRPPWQTCCHKMAQMRNNALRCF